MKRLIIKLSLFSMLILGVTHFLVSRIVVTPRKNFSPCQVNHLKNQIEDYNVLFVGSSRFGRQIDPVLFDSLNVDAGYHSYNYSFDAAFAPTSLNLAISTLSSQPKNLELLVLELAPVEFTEGLFPGHIQRSIGWYTVDDFLFLFQSRALKSLPLADKLRTIKDWSYLIFYRLSCVGEFWKRTLLSKNDCENHQRYPEAVPKIEFTEDLTAELENIRQSNSIKNLEGYKLNLSHSSYRTGLKKVEYLCQEQGVKLLYIVTPRMNNSDIRYIESLSKELDEKMVVRINAFEEFPHLYSDMLTADTKHVNEEGIHVFTSILSYKILEKTE